MERVEARVLSYQRNGLDAVELGAGVVADAESLSRIADLGGRFLVHNYFPPPVEPFVLNLASGDDTVRRRSLGLVSRGLALSASLGAPFYSVHAGFVTDPTGFGETNFLFPKHVAAGEVAMAMARFTAALTDGLEQARGSGVQLLVENNVCLRALRGKLLLQTAEEFLTLFRVVPPSHLGILLDTGHLNVSAHTLGFDRMAFVDRVAPYVRAFHLHDNDGTTDTHQPVQPGSWVLDVLRRTEFMELPLVLEPRVETVADLCRHVDWLKRQLGGG